MVDNWIIAVINSIILIELAVLIWLWRDQRKRDKQKIEILLGKTVSE